MAPAYRYLGALLLDAGNAELAIDSLQRAVALDAQHAEAYLRVQEGTSLQVFLLHCFLTPCFSITRGDVHTPSSLPAPRRTRNFPSRFVRYLLAVRAIYHFIPGLNRFAWIFQ